MAFDPHGKPTAAKPQQKIITLPSGTKMDEAAILRTCKRILTSPDAALFLDYLEYKAMAGAIHSQARPTEDSALYVLGRREFFDMIKRLSK